MTHNEAAQGNRITSLDFIRGVAVLGMLVANIPWHAGTSMSRVYEADFLSVLAWLSQYLIFDQRFMPLFCMLFGASIYLLAGDGGKRPQFNTYFLRRMAWLMLFGVAHAYLLWPGDILITYAVCGPFLLLFFRSPIWVLFSVGVLFKSVDLAFGEWPQLYTQTLERLLFSWWVEYGEAPSSAAAAYAGGYIDLLSYNAWRNQFIQWTALPYFRVWNALGFMLIGMGLFRLGLLQGGGSRSLYRKMMWGCLLAGLPLIAYGVLARIGASDTVGAYLGFTGELPLKNITFRTGCAVSSMALLAGLHLLYPQISSRVSTWVEAVGRMALTNYVFHSVFFLLLFHVLAPSYFDKLDHDAMFLLVLLVWIIQLVSSKLWLSFFRQGPLEALWRSLAGANQKS
ncbi:MAG: DUF418 domain-containing protein [Kordiimonas sp.]